MTSFTGSTAVGKRVAEIATATVKRLHLELGGKAPFVVFDDADLEAAVHGAVAGALINTGQDCTAATRAYVQRPLYDAFVAGVAELMETVRLGDPFAPGTDLGPAHLARPARPGRRFRRAGRVPTRTVVTGGEAPGRRAGQGRLLPAHPRSPDAAQDSEIVQSGDLRAGAGRPALRQRRRGHRAGQRHPLRPRRLRLEPGRLPGEPRHPRDQGGLRLGQRPHPDHQRDAARRVQGVRLRQGHVGVLLRGVHAGQARHVRQHRRWPARTGTARSSGTADRDTRPTDQRPPPSRKGTTRMEQYEPDRLSPAQLAAMRRSFRNGRAAPDPPVAAARLRAAARSPSAASAR